MADQYVVLQGGDLHPACVSTVYGPFDSLELAKAFAIAQETYSPGDDVEVVLLNVKREGT